VGGNRLLAAGTTDLGSLRKELRRLQEKHAHGGRRKFVDGYRNNPDMDFHSMVSEMADIPRKQAKVINLGMMYGMGVNKLSDS
jgi:hypothetical protein